jgi:ATP:corrinoid adenosyltransferase
MADEAASPKTSDAKEQARNTNEVALEMMKFIAVTTGYGKGATSAAGFSGKPNRTSEEYAESLLQLFERCRTVVDAKPDSK